MKNLILAIVSLAVGIGGGLAILSTTGCWNCGGPVPWPYALAFALLVTGGKYVGLFFAMGASIDYSVWSSARKQRA